MKLIKLSQGLFAQVDDEDYEYLNQWKWHTKKGDTTYYARRNTRLTDGNIKRILMHRLIMNAPAGIMIDHIDHNGLNNQKANLRSCTNQENQMNSRPCNATGYLGVHIISKGRQKGRITAYIRKNNKKTHLGSFKTQEQAALAYNNAAIIMFGEFANLNIV